VSPPHLIVIGGGLAGLAATIKLAPLGWKVTLLEARPRLGGRASSFADATTGQLVDACQHVTMGCCSAYADFCRTVGISHLLRPQDQLTFLTPDGRMSFWKADPFPAPFHFTRSFARAHFLTWTQKIKIASALLRLWWFPPEEDEPLREWLARNDQDQFCIERFWKVVLVSALNEAIDRVGVKYARQVFVEGFLSSRTGSQVWLPGVPLGQLYGVELQQFLSQHRVDVCLNTGVRDVHMQDSRATGVLLRSGQTMRADAYLLAVPSDRIADLLPENLRRNHVEFSCSEQLETSPITSVHFWYDQPMTSLPHAVLLDSCSQWLFNRGQTAPGKFYTQVVISASHALTELRNEQIQKKIHDELCAFFPLARRARLLHCRVVTEKTATFSVTPGVDRLRPAQQTFIDNLFLAGDWTQTNWPATMEGAVRSGYRAAQAIERTLGSHKRKNDLRA
jgi:squalene-associated FAD-dependent desaturase